MTVAFFPDTIKITHKEAVFYGKIDPSILSLIGRTPPLELTNIEAKEGLHAQLLTKLECMNFGGSVKDRTARFILEDARQKGLLDPDTVIVESTSGNTGIGLCTAAAVLRYRCIIVMPESMSREGGVIMSAFGAQVVLSPAVEGMGGAIGFRASARALRLKYWALLFRTAFSPYPKTMPMPRPGTWAGRRESWLGFPQALPSTLRSKRQSCQKTKKNHCGSSS